MEYRVLGLRALLVSPLLFACLMQACGARAPASTFIVEAADVGSARAAVRSAGGKVSSDLAIIDGVVAELSVAQRERLRRYAQVRRVFEDAPVELASLKSRVRDNFDAVQYTNNDGTHRWATAWTEVADDNKALTGKISVSPNLLGGGRMVFTGSGGGIARGASLPPGARRATLRFDARRISLESGDHLSVQASRDGGIQWTEVGRLIGPANDSSFTRLSFDLSRFISADTTVRLVNRLAPTLLNSDSVQVDNLEIEYDSIYSQGLSYPSLAGADRLHSEGVTGLLVTVAVLDSGYWKHPAVDTNALGLGRVLAQYDALAGNEEAQQISVLGLTSVGASVSTDESGHGAHVTGTILNTEKTFDGRFFGIAPNANLVSVRAFDADGRGSYASVIRGIDWVVRNKGAHNIRVLNLSLGAPPRSRYWDDPLNHAVMKAWQAGIVVVASAGNTGPGAQTVTVPGNVPYIITVGAMTDSYTPTDGSDDRLTSFSAAGPTFEGFVKPEVVAPGGHIWSLMPTFARIAQEHPAYQNDGDYFTMSGTSQAAAVVSGAVTLLLQAHPGLSPDEVKCMLMASARPAIDPAGGLAYSVFQQGAGLINAYDARYESERTCANQGLNIDRDLAGTEHYGGPARQNEQGEYYIAGSEAEIWNEEYAWDQGYAWNQGYAWRHGYSWNQGYVWRHSEYDWKDGEPWAPEERPAETAAMSINAWVEQE